MSVSIIEKKIPTTKTFYRVLYKNNNNNDAFTGGEVSEEVALTQLSSDEAAIAILRFEV